MTRAVQAEQAGSANPVASRPLSRDPMVLSWLGAVAVSEAGDAAWNVAVAWTAVQLASPAVAGVVIAAGAVPRAVLLLFGGVAADRHDPRRVMVVSNAVRLAALAVALVMGLGSGITVPVLLGLAIVLGATDAVYGPPASTIGKQLVAPHLLGRYAGMSQTLTRLGSLAGSSLGGVVVGVAGLPAVAALDAITFAATSLVLVCWLRPRYPLARAEAGPVLQAIGQGFGHLKGSPHTRALVIALSGVNLFVGPALSIGLNLRAQDAGWSATTVGLATGAVGLGGIIGSLAVTGWRPGRPGAVAFGALGVQALGIALLGWTSRPALIGVCVAIGVTAGVASSLLSALFVAVVDGAYLGRLASVLRLGDEALMPLAMAGFGVLAARAGVTAACVAAAAAMAALSLHSHVRSRTATLAPRTCTEEDG